MQVQKLYVLGWTGELVMVIFIIVWLENTKLTDWYRKQ